MSKRTREVTLASIVFGIVVGAIMNASITYAGLKIGFTIGGSAIAAVLGFGILRGVMRRGSILETNIGQTIASAVNVPNSGVIFTVPVLFLLFKEGLIDVDLSIHSSEFWLLTLACVAGAILGGAFIIPLRKQMLDIDRLRFPTGTAVATILKSPGSGAKKSLVLVAGIVVAMVIYLPAALPEIRLHEAELDELEDLVSQKKISKEDAERTRQIEDILATNTLPEQLVAKAHELQASIDTSATEKEEKRKLAKADPYLIDVYKVAQKELPLEHLRKYWVRKPLPGYSDLGWRLPMPAPADPNDPADVERFERQMREVDSDGDDQPDLALTSSLDVGRLLGVPSYIFLVFAIAPFSIGAGYITGRAGLVVLAGGILAYWVVNPTAYLMGWMPTELGPHSVANYSRVAFNRPLGIGMLLGGAMMGVLFALPSMKAAMKSMSSAARSAGGADELGFKVLFVAVLLASVGLFFAADLMQSRHAAESPVAQDGVNAEAPPAEDAKTDRGLLGGMHPKLKSLIIAVIGLAWIFFAGIIIAQCTGMTDWSPISGMALITVVLIMALAGTSDVLGAVLIGATLCVAVTCAADMMQDLKTGYLVGAIPKRQQVVELLTTGLGPLIAMLTIVFIAQTKPLGGEEIPAAQAQALGAVVKGVQGEEMPYVLYGAGATMGMALGLGSFPGLGVLVGLSMYLPFAYILPYGVGCLINMGVQRFKGRAWSEEWGVPFCAGLIVGEAVLALVINGVVLLTS